MTAANPALRRPREPRSLLRHAGRMWRVAHPSYSPGDAVRAVRRLAGRAVTVATDHGMTIAALGMVDYGCFRAATVAGWIVTGVSLLVFEAKVGT